MAWEHLSINKPHLAYTILGGFTTIFMLVSLFIKEKLYIGEATVATICGIIFGPSGLGWFNPSSWGNVDQITLEASRIVLVVQCFAVGVELPKKYMTRHWRSVIFLLIPVMTWGWLVTSLFIWWMIPPLTWLESLACAACVTATDPVLASSVVGKGKFARRIPKHLRDLLSAESGCNDGMAFPFIYLAIYLIDYRPDAGEVFQHWFCLTVLYECVFGSIYGICIGYAGRHAIKWAEKKQIIDRESFLVFYFVLALWCAGTGSMLGLDDLLVGFCAGVAFSNDGWFAQKTEESHVSNVIDLLLNLAYFVYFGSIIPWSAYNRPDWGITPWRLVVIAIFVILFRRIPIMVALKPLIPDIKTWREALFAGHFGPIGVGAIFVAILARAELEHGETTPLAVLPPPGSVNYMVIELIWPITTFLVISSIVVHGSSIAVFTLGKHVNTMRITMSYTTANEEPSWLTRLPRLTPRHSMSIRKPDLDDSEEKIGNGQEGLFPPGTLPPPGGIPGGFLARNSVVREDSPATSRPSSIRAKKRRNWEIGRGPGGPISDSAITPRRNIMGSPVSLGRSEEIATPEPAAKKDSGKDYGHDIEPTETTERRIETFQEGRDIILENEQGDVLAQTKSPSRPHVEDGGPLNSSHLGAAAKNLLSKSKDEEDKAGSDISDESAAVAAEVDKDGKGKHRKRENAWAYRFDDNVIVEDADGEVIRRYKLPKNRSESSPASSSKNMWTDWASIFGRKGKSKADQDNDDDDAKTVYSQGDDEERKEVHFRMRDEKGRRMSKQEFFHQLQKMGPHARAAMTSRSDLSMKARQEIAEALSRPSPNVGIPNSKDFEPGVYARSSGDTSAEAPEKSEPPVTRTDSHKSGDDRDEETAAERKRREAALGIRENEEDSDDEGQQVPARGQSPSPGTMMRSLGIRFADQTPVNSRPSSSGGNRGVTLSWGEDVKGKSRE